MAKQIIRLTESDLHNIIRESVKRVLREQDETPLYTQDDLEAAANKVRALKKGGDKKAWLEAAQEYQKIKEYLGKANVINQPDANWSREKNDELGKYTHDEWLRCDPRKRKDVKKKPKASEITKGREQIAKDAFEREKDLRRKEQGSMGAVAGD